MPRTVLGSLLLAQLVAAEGFAQASPSPSALASMLPPSDKLPACAKVKEIKPGDELPCGVKTNPVVCSARALVSCMADMVLGRMAKDSGVRPEQATEASFVMYEAGSEIGVIAFSFADPAAASAASKAFERVIGTDARGAVLAGGTAAGFMSCDPGVEEDCCQEVKALVLDSWKKASAR